MKLSEMKTALAERDLTLTKSLGQNFLHDQNQIRRIVDAAEVAPSDKILEIGPGLGPLTELLAARAGEVLAIEKDQRLFDFLVTKYSESATLKLLHADALDYVKQHREWGGWKLVANLPYSVASPILIELAWAGTPPKSLIATLQLEVVERIAAGAGDDHYGLMSLLMQLNYEVRTWFKIPSTCFFPAPDVDSACIILQQRPTAILPQPLHRNFMRVVKRGFSQRRKMMLKLLKQDWPPDKLQAGFAAAGISQQARAEQVSLEQFVRLTETISTMSEEIFDIVNERDEVIGQMPRSQVHREGRLHRAIHVLVFNKRGQIFLQKRSMRKDRFPGAWDSSSSGHVDQGEDYDACAIRELKEEIGLVAEKPLQRLFKIDGCPETDQEFVWVYRLESEGPFELNADEIERGEWFTPEQVASLIASPPGQVADAFVLIWKKISGLAP